ncbi:MAG: YceI family protein [Gaiellaceae bacterium]
MSIPAGTHTFGPENSALWLMTTRTGAAAAAGHDLLIHVTAWQATLEVGADPGQTSVVFEADATSLRVRDGIGGMQPLGDDDKSGIEQTIDDEILKQMDIEFRSTAVQSAADGSRISVEGQLTIVGQARPIAFELTVGDDGRLTGNTVVTQTTWGITPYSTLFGALKVGDDVKVVIDASSGPADPDRVAEGPELPDAFETEWHHEPIIDPGVSSFLWALVFFLYLWFGMAAVGVSTGSALVLALVASFLIFLFVRTHGVGREDT